jgi:hypothetical protein
MTAAKPIIASYADGGRYWPRTQRDAGIEFMEWDGRLRPVKSWAQIAILVAEFLGLAWFIGACIFLATAG